MPLSPRRLVAYGFDRSRPHCPSTRLYYQLFVVVPYMAKVFDFTQDIKKRRVSNSGLLQGISNLCHRYENSLGQGSNSRHHRGDHKIDVDCQATQDLDTLLSQTGLVNLLNISRPMILSLCNRRQCQENRAEAIMSAIGVEDWYHDRQVGDPCRLPPTADLATRYPLPFLQEASRKIGAGPHASTFRGHVDDTSRLERPYQESRHCILHWAEPPSSPKDQMCY